MLDVTDEEVDWVKKAEVDLEFEAPSRMHFSLFDTMMQRSILEIQEAEDAHILAILSRVAS